MRRPPALLLLLCACSSAKPESRVPDETRKLHDDAVVVDAHAGTTEAMFYEKYDIAVRHADHSIDLPRMREGGLDAEFFTVFVHPESVDIHQFFPEAMKQLDLLEQVARANAPGAKLARTAQEVRDNARAGVTSMLIGVEGGHMLLPGDDEEQLTHVATFAARGVRWMTLAWSSSSPIGGATAEGAGTGLTPFGIRAVREMEQQGIVVDLSHASDPLFWDVIRMAKKPVLMTNTAARALSNHPRNASDDMITAVARNGGAVCVNFSRTFLDDKFRRGAQALLQKTKAMRNSDKVKLYAQQQPPLPDVPLSRLVDHIQHIALVAGYDHVCLGSGFDEFPVMPNGMEDASKLPALTRALKERGFSDENIRKVMGENVLRVLAASEAR